MKKFCILSALIAFSTFLNIKAMETELHVAAKGGDTARAQQLIASGAEPNAKDKYGYTPLHLASLNGHTQVVKLLLSFANPNVKDSYNRTPLHLASSIGNAPIVELLLAKGTDINAKGLFDRTPLHLASLSGHDQIAQLLLAKGANPNAKDEEGKAPLDRAREKGHNNIIKILENWKSGQPQSSKVQELSMIRSSLSGLNYAVKT